MNPLTVGKAEIFPRTFDAAGEAMGSVERAAFNSNPITSEYYTSQKWVVRVPCVMSDGSKNPAQPFHYHTFKTRAQAQLFAEKQ